MYLIALRVKLRYVVHPELVGLDENRGLVGSHCVLTPIRCGYDDGLGVGEQWNTIGLARFDAGLDSRSGCWEEPINQVGREYGKGDSKR